MTGDPSELVPKIASGEGSAVFALQILQLVVCVDQPARFLEKRSAQPQEFRWEILCFVYEYSVVDVGFLAVSQCG